MGTEGKNNIMVHDGAVSEKLKRLVSSESYQFQRRRMLDLLTIPNDPIAVCDVGCGEGSFCRDLRERLPMGSNIVGLDTSSFVLDMARSQEVVGKRSIQYLQGDAQKLSFAPESFDIVVCAGMIKYLKTEDAERRALRRQVDALCLGGQLLVVDSDDCDISFQGIDPNLSQKIVNAYVDLQGDPKSGSRVKNLCESIGLIDIKQEIISLEETEFTSIHAGQAMAQNMRDVLKNLAIENPDKAQVFPEEIDEFYTQVVESAYNGKYKWNYVKYAVVGRKRE